MAPQIKFTAFGIPYLVEFSDVVFLSNGSRRPTINRSSSLPILSRPARPKLSRSSTTRSRISKLVGFFAFSKDSRKRGRPSSNNLSTSPGQTCEVDQPLPRVQLAALSSTGGVTQSMPHPTSESTAASLPFASSHARAKSSFDWSVPKQLPLRIITPSTSGRSPYADGLYVRSQKQSVGPRSARAVKELRKTIAVALQKAGIETPEGAVASREELAAQLSRGEYGEFKAALHTVGLMYEKCVETKALPDGRPRVAMLARNGRDRVHDQNAPLKICAATRLGSMFVTKKTDNGQVELKRFTLWA